VTLRLRRVSEDARRLDDDVDAQVALRQRGRAFLDLEGLDPVVADDDGVLTVEADILRQPAEDRVVLSRWARVALSVRSLTATISMSVVPSAFCASTARKKLRPIRPKPFTPTRTVTITLLCPFLLVVPVLPAAAPETSAPTGRTHRSM